MNPIPVSGGVWEKKFSRASRPPAEAPNAAITNRLEGVSSSLPTSPPERSPNADKELRWIAELPVEISSPRHFKGHRWAFASIYHSDKFTRAAIPSRAIPRHSSRRQRRDFGLRFRRRLPRVAQTVTITRLVSSRCSQIKRIEHKSCSFGQANKPQSRGPILAYVDTSGRTNAETKTRKERP